MGKIIESGCGNTTELADEDVADEIFMTEDARTKISEILSESDEGSFLRVGVQGGGCSGFQYFFGIMADLDEKEDIVKEWDGAKIVVDSASMEFIKGATIGYTLQWQGAYFTVDNPLATSTCGCGSSFS